MRSETRVRPSRRQVLGGAVAAGAMLAAPAVVRAQAKALKVAVLLPRSGLLAAAGQACHRGAVVSPKVLADFGYAVELINVDFESNVDVARTQTERAIAEGANCVVGAFESGATLAIAQVCEQRQVPLVINIGSVPPSDIYTLAPEERRAGGASGEPGQRDQQDVRESDPQHARRELELVRVGEEARREDRHEGRRREQACGQPGRARRAQAVDERARGAPARCRPLARCR